ncbi:hypothetical protein As57867_004493, partial [Aphanomyces stellatus]
MNRSAFPWRRRSSLVLAFVLISLLVTAADAQTISAEAVVFFSSNFTGRNATIKLAPFDANARGWSVFHDVQSFQVPFGCVLVGWRGQTSHRHLSWTTDVSAIDLPFIFAWNLYTATDANKIPPNQAETAVLGYRSANFADAQPYVEFEVGDSWPIDTPLPSLLSFHVPPSLAVQAYTTPNLTHRAYRWTSDQPDLRAHAQTAFASFRVDREPVNPSGNNVTMYSDVNFTGRSLVMHAGESIISEVFMYGAGVGVTSLIVPPSLVFVGYESEYFQGARDIWYDSDGYRPSVFALNDPKASNQLRSYQVFDRVSFDVATSLGPVPDRTQLVQCTIRTFNDQVETVASVYDQGAYPIIPSKSCDRMYIPASVAVVACDRSWHLGTCEVWTAPVVNLGVWMWRMRSLTVVSRRDAPPPTVPAVPQYVSVSSQKFYTGYFREGEDMAAVEPWATYQHPESGGLGVSVPAGLVAAFYTGYNFQGNVTIVDPDNNETPRLYATFQSVKVRNRALWSSDMVFQTSFVGCFTPWDPVTPIFLQANESIARFIYPWDQYVTKLTIPKGLVVIGYDQVNYGGDLMVWAADNSSLGDWDRRIRSIKVKRADEWSTDAPPAATTSRTPTTSEAPSNAPSSTSTPSSVSKPTGGQPSPTSATDEGENYTDAPSTLQVDTTAQTTTPRATSFQTPRPAGGGPTLTTSFTPSSSSKRPSNATNASTSAHDTINPPSSDIAAPPSPDLGVTQTHGSHGFSPLATLLLGATGAIVVSAVVLFTVTRQRRTPGPPPVLSATQYHNLDWKDLDLARLDMVPFPLTKQIAMGATGSIWIGTHKNTPVVVKTFLTSAPTEAQVQDLIDEIAFMSSLSTPFIVTLVGAAWTHPSNLQAVLEYMNLGDLREFLAKTPIEAFAWQNKLECVLGVAEALF